MTGAATSPEGGSTQRTNGAAPGSAPEPIRWTAPGPGTWELDTTHFSPLVSRPMRDLIEETMSTGLREGFDLFGSPLSEVTARFVNGRMYLRQVPLIGGGRDLPPPPAPVLWLVTRLHPRFRRRTRTAEAALRDRIWLAEYERWETTWKPELISANRAFASVDVDSLDDGRLADHVDRLDAHLSWTFALHFRLHVSDLGPIGRLLVAAEDLGLDPVLTMAALAGSSPSSSAPAAAIAEIRDELESAGVDPSDLDGVRNASSRAAELLDAYLTDYGTRLTVGYDIRDRTLAEMPELVLRSILDTRAATGPDASDRGRDAYETLLAAVPASKHDELATMIDDARRLYGLRDENGPLTVEWPAGVLRRAVVETGRRLVERGRIVDPEHIFDATAEEISAMLRGADEPTAVDLADRCRERFDRSLATPVPGLGREASIPPVGVLPGEMSTLMRGILTVMKLLDGDLDVLVAGEGDERALTGTGIGDVTYRGTARVVTDAADALDRAEPGDVIVAKLTVPTFNAVLAMAGAVVTENGGLLCHTAVIARELGIPAVVGAAAALTSIPDGSTVEVDPIAGVVRVVE